MNQWIRIYNAGQDQGDHNEERVKSAYVTQSGVVPRLKTTIKDHKVTAEGEDPKTRPIADASICMNSSLGDFLAKILKHVNDEKKDSEDTISPEEALQYVEEAAMRIRKVGRNIVVGSLDVSALYPSLNIEIL